MNNRFYIKIVTIMFFSIIMILINFCNISYAIERYSIYTGGNGSVGGTTESVVDPIEDPTYFTPIPGNSEKLTSIGKTILAVINVVGVVVAVVALGIIGLRYMFGSVEERANYKETMIPYIIGLVMLGGITTIVNIIYNIASKIEK